MNHDTEIAPAVLTVAEVADMWSVHPDTIRRWAGEGRIPAFRTPTGRWRFHRADMNALADALTDGGDDDG